eukprot:1967391-Pyramimonas_sp.AAC.1
MGRRIRNFGACPPLWRPSWGRHTALLGRPRAFMGAAGPVPRRCRRLQGPSWSVRNVDKETTPNTSKNYTKIMIFASRGFMGPRAPTEAGPGPSWRSLGDLGGRSENMFGALGAC